MCLGIPGRVVRTFHEHDVLMGKVDFGGVSKQVCLEHVPDVQIGQYVLVHVGFALSKIDEEEARLVFEFLGRMNQLDELNVASPGDSPSIPSPGTPGEGQGGGSRDRFSSDRPLPNPPPEYRGREKSPSSASWAPEGGRTSP